MAQDRYLLYCEAVPGCCFQLDVTDPPSVVTHLKTHPGVVPAGTETLVVECPRCETVLYRVRLAALDQEPAPGNLLRGWTHVTKREGECPKLTRGETIGHKFSFKSFIGDSRTT